MAQSHQPDPFDIERTLDEVKIALAEAAYVAKADRVFAEHTGEIVELLERVVEAVDQWGEHRDILRLTSAWTTLEEARERLRQIGQHEALQHLLPNLSHWKNLQRRLNPRNRVVTPEEDDREE